MISNKFSLAKIMSLEQCFVFVGGKFCIVEIIFGKRNIPSQYFLVFEKNY
jgi:hypothetical protein